MTDPRFCPQCAHALATQPRDGRPRLVCPACGWTHYPQAKVCAAAIVTQGDDVLLVRRAREPYAGAWGLPAGYVEIDETPAQAAAREVEEETGLTVTIGPLVGVYPFSDDPRGPGILFAYLAHPVEGGLRDGGEGEPRWTPLADLPVDLVGAGQSEALREWQARSRESGYNVRFCVRCGAPTETSELFGRPRPLCPACGLIHFREPKTASGVLIEQDGKALLAKRAMNPGRGLWYVPSGYVDWDERAEEAAVREMQEETGLEVEITGLFGVYGFGDAQTGAGTFVLYRGRVVGGTLQPGDDVSAVAFFGPDELPPLAFDTSRAAIERWVEEGQRARTAST